jgi:hypothetical protein
MVVLYREPCLARAGENGTEGPKMKMQFVRGQVLVVERHLPVPAVVRGEGDFEEERLNIEVDGAGGVMT